MQFFGAPRSSIPFDAVTYRTKVDERKIKIREGPTNFRHIYVSALLNIE